MKPATRIHGLHGLKPLAKEIQQRHAQQLALRQAQEAAARQADREGNLFALWVGREPPPPVKNIFQKKQKKYLQSRCSCILMSKTCCAKP
mgnify:CR=1 FL=1